mmetsp:Transcript_40577/g.63353  ORF Transcript_40577/g.63353 Transcript_40577/m.63353 type:complete len:461 (+) Transcript_40577:13-1395(+)
MAPYGTMSSLSQVPRAPRSRSYTSVVVAVAVLGACALAGSQLLSSSAPVELQEIHVNNLAKTYVSDSQARKQLDSYYEDKTFSVAKHGLSSAEALKQMDAIWKTPGSKNVLAKVRATQKKQVMQDLAFSSSSAQDDLDSYFDNLEGGTTHKAASHHHKKYDTSSASDDMDSYWDNQQKKASSHKWHHQDPLPAAKMQEAKKNALNRYKEQHPNFKAKLDKVHEDWMKNVGHFPKNEAEKKRYQAEVAKVVNSVKIDIMPEDMPSAKQATTQQKTTSQPSGHQATHEEAQKYIKDHPELKSNLEKKAKDTWAKEQGKGLKGSPEERKAALANYLKQHPEVKKKMEEAKKAWFTAHGNKPPQGTHENEQYAKLMKEYVGHIDIPMSKYAKAKTTKKAEVSKDTKADHEENVDHLKEFEAKNPEMKKKIEKVHKMWAAGHSKPPSTDAEKKEYWDMMHTELGY